MERGFPCLSVWPVCFPLQAFHRPPFLPVVVSVNVGQFVTQYPPAFPAALAAVNPDKVMIGPLLGKSSDFAPQLWREVQESYLYSFPAVYHFIVPFPDSVPGVGKTYPAPVPGSCFRGVKGGGPGLLFYLLFCRCAECFPFYFTITSRK